MLIPSVNLSALKLTKPNKLQQRPVDLFLYVNNPVAIELFPQITTMTIIRVKIFPIYPPNRNSSRRVLVVLITSYIFAMQSSNSVKAF